ncbi:MAG: tetratricopeptide repeat protein [Myxococcota bacterium]
MTQPERLQDDPKSDVGRLLSGLPSPEPSPGAATRSWRALQGRLAPSRGVRAGWFLAGATLATLVTLVVVRPFAREAPGFVVVRDGARVDSRSVALDVPGRLEVTSNATPVEVRTPREVLIVHQAIASIEVRADGSVVVHVERGEVYLRGRDAWISAGRTETLLPGATEAPGAASARRETTDIASAPAVSVKDGAARSVETPSVGDGAKAVETPVSARDGVANSGETLGIASARDSAKASQSSDIASVRDGAKASQSGIDGVRDGAKVSQSSGIESVRDGAKSTQSSGIESVRDAKSAQTPGIDGARDGVGSARSSIPSVRDGAKAPQSGIESVRDGAKESSVIPSVRDGAKAAEMPTVSVRDNNAVRDGATTAETPPIPIVRDGAKAAETPAVSVRDGAKAAETPAVSVRDGAKAAETPPIPSVRDGTANSETPALGTPRGSEEQARLRAALNLRRTDARGAAQQLEVLGSSATVGELALYELGRLQAGPLQQPAIAVQTFRTARSRFPSGALRSELGVSLVEALLAARRPTEALTELDLLAGTAAARERRDELTMLRGDILRGLARYADASAVVRPLADGDSRFAERALLTLADCESRLGHAEAAREALRAVLRRFPAGAHAAEARRALGE